MEDKKKNRSSCGISQSLDIFGDKWSLLIIRDLVYFGKETYGDLLKMDEGIATNVLADRLVVLEKEGLITKEIFVGSKSKYKYKLTEKGIDLYPIIAEILLWGSKYCEVMPEQKMFAKMTKQKRETFVRDVMKKRLKDLAERS
ncbi:MAG: helix-turn-helix domain-containing protein [Leptospiraceae bacterium]|nr:helix-turn-helix domain-containing protein [Leptospiraceae bacterium]